MLGPRVLNSTKGTQNRIRRVRLCPTSAVKQTHSGCCGCNSKCWSRRLHRSSTSKSSAVPEGVVPGFRTVPTPRLTAEGVIERLYNIVPDHARQHFKSFYSSELSGIVTNPAFMMVHLDDHMVHRGHAVYETIRMYHGYVYLLPQHAERLRHAASMIGVDIGISNEALLRIILDTAAASLKLDGTIKVWASAGRGTMGISNKDCEASLYVLVTTEYDDVDTSAGWSVVTSPVEPPAEYFAGIRSTGDVQRVLCHIEAEQRDFNTGLFVDEEGIVLEAANMNLGMLTREGDLVIAESNRALPSVELERLIEIIPEMKEEEEMDVPRAIVRRPIQVDELAGAAEVFLVSSSLGVVPVVSVDEQPISKGEVGEFALRLNGMLNYEIENGSQKSKVHMEVPYGYLTGMKSQMV